MIPDRLGQLGGVVGHKVVSGPSLGYPLSRGRVHHCQLKQCNVSNKYFRQTTKTYFN